MSIVTADKKGRIIIKLRQRFYLCSVAIKMYFPQLSELQLNTFRNVSQIYFQYLVKLLNQHGLVNTCKYIKTLRLLFLRFISGDPLYRFEGVSINKSGYPRNLHFFKNMLDLEDHVSLKFILTLLILLRDTRSKPILDLNPIERRWGGKLPEVSAREHRIICAHLNIMPLTTEWNNFHYTTKMGPNGPALFTTSVDYLGLPEATKMHLGILGGSRFVTQMELVESVQQKYPEGFQMLLRVLPKQLRRKHTCMRRLSTFSDKETKSRTIAIFDYWTQTVLRPIHSALNSLLKRIPQDCTFNQSSFTDFMLKYYDKGITYCSLDLTNATDRMPIELQQIILKEIIGEERSNSWKHVMVGLPFQYHTGYIETRDIKDPLLSKSRKELRYKYKKLYPQYNDKDLIELTKYQLIEEIRKIKKRPTKINDVQYAYYRAGQPMGAYSLWPIMALTHHYIVRLAALRCGILPFYDYCILGDDIVIANERVGSEYVDLLNILDMPISFHKTHKSKYFFEFAKRYFYKGEEITPYSVATLDQVYHRYYLLANFLDNQAMHGWTLARDRVPEFILELTKVFSVPWFGKRMNKLIIPFQIISETRTFGYPHVETIMSFIEEFQTSLLTAHPDALITFFCEGIKHIRKEQILSEIALCKKNITKLSRVIGDTVVRALGSVEEFYRIVVPINGWGPFACCMYNMTSGALADFALELGQGGLEEFLLNEEENPNETAQSLLKLRGLIERTMKPNIMQFRDAKQVELFTQSILTKKLINWVQENLWWFNLRCLNGEDIFQN